MRRRSSDFAQEEPLFDIFGVGAFDLGFTPAGIVHISRHFGGPFQGIQGLIGLTLFDVSLPSEAVLCLFG